MVMYTYFSLLDTNKSASKTPGKRMGLNVDQELFGVFAFYNAVVILKMILMAFLTARQRFRTGSPVSSEDAGIVGNAGPNEDVERVRRAHLNDLENILPFFCLSILYIFTEPALSTATLLFRIFAACRIVHTVAYVLPLPQPTRTLSFFGGVAVNYYMAFNILATFA